MSGGTVLRDTDDETRVGVGTVSHDETERRGPTLFEVPVDDREGWGCPQ